MLLIASPEALGLNSLVAEYPQRLFCHADRLAMIIEALAAGDR